MRKMLDPMSRLPKVDKFSLAFGSKWVGTGYDEVPWQQRVVVLAIMASSVACLELRLEPTGSPLWLIDLVTILQHLAVCKVSI